MNSRLELHEILCDILDMQEPNGDRHVYFDPPESIKMHYPAIRYVRKNIDKIHANNKAYKNRKAYEVILIDSNPDSEFIDKLLQLEYCSYDRHYKADKLNHDIFTIYI